MVLLPFFGRELAERSLDPAGERLVRSFAADAYLVLDGLGLRDFDAIATAPRVLATVELLYRRHPIPFTDRRS